MPQNLLAGDAATARVADDALIANAQAWLDLVKADLNLTEGEVTMFIPDMPNLPPQDAPVMIAQANQAQSGNTTKVRTFGVCSPKPNKYYSLDNVVIPITSAGKYLLGYESRTPPASATTTILQPPKHGVLRLVTQADVGTILENLVVIQLIQQPVCIFTCRIPTTLATTAPPSRWISATASRST